MVRFWSPELSTLAKLSPKKSRKKSGRVQPKKRIVGEISKIWPLASGLASAGRAKRKQLSQLPRGIAFTQSPPTCAVACPAFVAQPKVEAGFRCP